MAVQMSEGDVSKRHKRLLIPLLVIMVLFSIVFLYILPMLDTQPHSVYVDPSEFHIRTFDLDAIFEDKRSDFIYRSLASDPFEPIEVVAREEDSYYDFEEEPDPIPETLPFRLTGVLTDGGIRKIILEGEQESFILEEGDSFDQYEVVEIDKDTVMVRSEGSMYRFMLGGTSGESI